MPELDIHIRLASLEADVAAIRNFLVGEHGWNALPPARVDHPSIMQAPTPVSDPPPEKPWAEVKAEANTD